MDETKRLREEEFNNIASQHNFSRKLLIKDYFITLILFLIKDVDGIYFKGGTALNKIFLNHARLSEDIDFTLTRNENVVKEEISKVLKDSGFFDSITEGKIRDGFLRMIAKYKFGLNEGEIFIDLNKRATIHLKTEIHKINHFYQEFIPEFSIKTLNREEISAEKLRAAITRNKPRDHYDVYMIIKKKIPFNLEVAEKKCKESGKEFSIIKMFNKAQILKNKWDEDMASLISEPITFQEVIKFLAKHFNLKKEKDKLKKK